MNDTRAEISTPKSIPAVQPTAAPVQRPAAAARGLHFDRHFTTPGVTPTTRSPGSSATPSSRTGRASSSSSRRTSSPRRLVHDRDQHRRLASTSTASSARPSASPASAPSSPASPNPSATGACATATSPPPTTPRPSTPSSPTCSSTRRSPSTPPSGSTSAATASSPTPTPRTGTGTPTARQVTFSATGYSKPQCSACFINSVQDSLDSILTLAKTEGMLFKWGSGAGSNLSSIRGSMETLSGGGTASGPLSFMRGFDAFAGVIKSGGKTRRAAKMVVLNVDHPDIVDFIECKVQGRSQGLDPHRRRLRRLRPRLRSLHLHLLPERQQLRPRHRRVHARRRARRRLLHPHRQGRNPVTTCPARDLMHKIAEDTWAVRRPRHAVRHHHQPLAHLQKHRPHQRLQPLLGVHVPRRLRLQPRQLQPPQVRHPRRPVRHPRLPPRHRHRHHRDGDHRRLRRLPHRA